MRRSRQRSSLPSVARIEVDELRRAPAGARVVRARTRLRGAASDLHRGRGGLRQVSLHRVGEVTMAEHALEARPQGLRVTVTPTLPPPICWRLQPPWIATSPHYNDHRNASDQDHDAD